MPLSNALSRRALLGSGLLLAAGAVAPRLARAQSDLPLASAINRSGLMRAMSQRIAKLQTQIALGVTPAAARQALMAAQKVVTDSMGELSLASHRDASLADPFARLSKHMDELLTLVHKPTPLTGTLALSEQADEVQTAANAMTEAFQALSAVPTARVVNVSGRQRMLSQRMAKIRFVQAAGHRSEALNRQAEDSRADFVRALDYLHEVPVTSAAIRRQLGIAAAQWKRYDRLLDRADSRAGLQGVASESEKILVTVDRLTQLYNAALLDLLG